MLKKFSIVLSLAAVLGFGLTLSTPDLAFAKPVQNKNVNKNVKVNKNVNVNKNFKVNKNVNVKKNFQVNKNFKGQKWVSGKKYGNNYYFGHNRHLWRGRWYDYGDGPCWINIDGEWFWNILVCPL